MLKSNGRVIPSGARHACALPLLVVLVGGAGCHLLAGYDPGEANSEANAEPPLPRDEAPSWDAGPDGDAGPEGDAFAAPPCSAGGAERPCDPVSGGGCAQGGCVLTIWDYTACVCPAGVQKERAPCDPITLPCAPGLVCTFKTGVLGECLPLCRLGETCADGRLCTAFGRQPNPLYGFCEYR